MSKAYILAADEALEAVEACDKELRRFDEDEIQEIPRLRILEAARDILAGEVIVVEKVEGVVIRPVEPPSNGHLERVPFGWLDFEGDGRTGVHKAAGVLVVAVDGEEPHTMLVHQLADGRILGVVPLPDGVGLYREKGTEHVGDDTGGE